MVRVWTVDRFTTIDSGATIRLIGCAVYQYGLLSFQTGGTKLERFLRKNQHPQRKLLNFENWISGKVSKNEYHFSISKVI